MSPYQKEGVCTKRYAQSNAIDDFLSCPFGNDVVCNQHEDGANQKPKMMS